MSATHKKSTVKTRLSINGLKLNIYFGWPKDERLRKQLIHLDITLEFPQPPNACKTDQLADTFCYAKLAATIREEINLRHCRLVEHLAYEIYNIIKNVISQPVKIGVAITKYPSTVPDLQNGVTFYYEDG
ncbi:MAG: hypothetical protein A3E83_02510 [Gammaproteobacteria bacterium RIFCSPHIGHO2_12_FULL_41_20]|nr:MAG: hypothetical protein A3E83_02510 [Gammaproteobacteria bacterium RIFCSPHIGHO2_12_FULL_41_20]